ncbi:MAG: aldo/keto reductase, partial [Hymenobacteraceae bacterium]|nr:aldo/keto reductase [Hymenobacteraceae bacterium]
QHLPRYQVFQPGYNLYDRQEFEQGVAQLCQQEGLGVITYFSLASGFLTGKYRSKQDLDKSVRGSGVDKYLNERGTRILTVLDKMAEKHQVQQAAVALAWLVQNPLVTAPIASATKPKHLQAFTEAAQLQLSPEDVQQLEEASAY